MKETNKQLIAQVKTIELMSALEAVEKGRSKVKQDLTNILSCIQISKADEGEDMLMLTGCDGNLLFNIPLALYSDISSKEDAEDNKAFVSEDLDFIFNDLSVLMPFLKSVYKQNKTSFVDIVIENMVMTISDKVGQVSIQRSEGNYVTWKHLIPKDEDDTDIELVLGLPILEKLVSAMKKSQEYCSEVNLKVKLNEVVDGICDLNVVKPIVFETKSSSGLSGLVMGIKNDKDRFCKKIEKVSKEDKELAETKAKLEAQEKEKEGTKC